MDSPRAVDDPDAPARANLCDPGHPGDHGASVPFPAPPLVQPLPTYLP
ncbi:MAG: hypothetical protein L6Q98_14865 [Anaerolineae bacterium]|nr:hypothetical protein [Anaerolineae bacterium]NUQ04084.1 hypothetical protein [Anaerolineae bacterium]